MSEELLICNAAHKCHIEKCYHKQPHKSNFGEQCGPSMHCYPANILSGCVKITDGKYKTYERESCPHCNGKGFKEIVITHEVSTQASPSEAGCDEQ